MSAEPVAGRYHIKDLIGEGAWSLVYQARDTVSDEIVALKELRADIIMLVPEALERFQREAEALRILEHPHIVHIRDAFEENDTHYIVLEYVNGGSLKTLLDGETALPLEKILRLTLQLADALNAAHSLKIIHRDLKPANILLTKDGDLRLTDFGIAHMMDMRRLTKTGMLMGTMHYLAPEAFTGIRADRLSDIWALGILSFQMLTGQLPFTGKRDTQTMEAILKAELPDIQALRSDCPPGWQKLIEKMLTRDRDRRISSMHKVAMQLLAVAHEMQIELK